MTATRLPARSFDTAPSAPRQMLQASSSPAAHSARSSSIAPFASSGCAKAQSDAKRSRRPMPTGSPFLPRVHRPSHCDSCGHTRPQMAGSAFALFTIA